MLLAVDECDLDVHHREPGQHAGGHSLAHALLDAGDMSLGDRSADSLVNE